MIELRDITFAYDAPREVLRVPRLDIGAGLVLVVGQNGAGKSTLLRLIAGVDAPAAGTVVIAGHDMWVAEVAARRHVAFVPEAPELTPYAAVIDAIRLVAALRGATESDAVAALERVGLLDVGRRTIRELSMGQRRRAMLATALIATPAVVILDEPLETLDAQMRVFLCDWVGTLRAAGNVVVVATHELEPFAAMVDSVIAVRAGEVRAHAIPPDMELSRRSALLAEIARGS